MRWFSFSAMSTKRSNEAIAPGMRAADEAAVTHIVT
jgi:hypothetical protein